MPKFGLLNDSDSDEEDENGTAIQENGISSPKKSPIPPILKTISTQQSVYVPDGVDPAAIKKAHYFFNRNPPQQHQQQPAQFESDESDESMAADFPEQQNIMPSMASIFRQNNFYFESAERPYDDTYVI